MNPDFRRFWIGQTVSAFGTSFTELALPLLVFKLTGSPVVLAAAAALTAVPHLAFGLLIGAWADRMDRRRLMIAVDVLAAATAASVPASGALGLLGVGWVFVVVFVLATLSIFFRAAEFGAIPSLVEREELVTANGRIQASLATATVAVPLVAGALLVVLPLERLLLVDAASFLVSAIALGLIRRSFNGPATGARKSLGADVVDGLRYVLRHPVLRNISLMMALVNFVSSSAFAELVLFAKLRYGASDTEIGILFAAGGVGVVLMSLAAGSLRKRWTFGTVALGALMASGLFIVALSLAPSFWIAVPLWGLAAGLGVLFNINTGSLRQAIVPNRMLGRIITIAMVLAWSAQPLGTMLGGFAIEQTGDVQLVYAAIGIATFLIPLAFWRFSPLGHAERYLIDGDPAAGAISGGRT